jgi:predicted amidohydrolase YtcJ
MRHTPYFAAIAIMSAISFASIDQAGRWSPDADWILTGGQVVTVDRNFSLHKAIAVKDDKIIAVGTEPEVRKLAGVSTRILNLAGKVVIPGLQDSHIHFLGLGRDIRYEADLTYARDAGEILAAMTALKKRLNPVAGGWLVGNRWDQYKYPEMVTRWQLDAIAPENPVRLHRVYRGICVNTLVFKMMGIEDEKPGTWPAWWLKDPENFTFEDKIFRARRTVVVGGKPQELMIPAGAFVGLRAGALVRIPAATAGFEDDVESVKYGVEEMLRLGVTSLVDPSSDMGYNMRVYQEAYNRGHLKMRIAGVYEGTFMAHKPDAIRRHLDAIRINNLGDAFLRWRGAKYYSDGGAGTRSAWLSEPFARSAELERAPNLGNPVVADSATREAQYRAALEFGWELHTHACGDQAMRQAVDLYKKLADEIHKVRPDADLRWSLIHAYLPMEPKTNMLQEMARYGIIASLNPVFNWQEGAAFAANLGPERFARTQPFRSYVKAGVLVTSGSDYDVTSHNPWIGIYALLTRKDQTSGRIYGPEETLDIAAALRTYTINGAHLTYDEKTRGSLEVGKAADLAVLDIADIRELQKNPEMCFQMENKILLTVVGGRTRYQSKEFARATGSKDISIRKP